MHPSPSLNHPLNLNWFSNYIDYNSFFIFYFSITRKWLSSLLILGLPRSIVEISSHHSLLLITCPLRYCICSKYQYYLLSLLHALCALMILDLSNSVSMECGSNWMKPYMCETLTGCETVRISEQVCWTKRGARKGSEQAWQSRLGLGRDPENNIMDSLFSSRLAHKAHAWLVCASHLSISMLGIDILREKTREKREAFSVSMTCETIVCD